MSGSMLVARRAQPAALKMVIWYWSFTLGQSGALRNELPQEISASSDVAYFRITELLTIVRVNPLGSAVNWVRGRLGSVRGKIGPQ